MAAATVRIIIEVAGEAPLEVDLDPGTYVLGREEGCELFIANDGISRRHARLTVSDSGVTAEDLGSSNGSFLDGAAVSEPVALATLSTFVLGAEAVSIRLEADEQVDTMAPSAPASAVPEPAGEVNLFDANYAFRQEIARGGMGAVIEAEDQNTGRTVAIKKMLSEGNASEESKHRFLQEARVMGHLEHPNIVPMHELALDAEGMPYYTMKRIQGTDLQDVLTRIKNGNEETIAAYPLRTLLGIFLKVCDAMAFAHTRGVIHRDLKPENIMLGEFGEVLVADWGLAKILPGTPLAFLHMAVEEGTEISEDEVSEEGAFKTMEGSVMGTPNYMAPEQAEGNTVEIDRLSDIFSLGGILYSILTLRPPVLGKTVSELLENMRAGYIAPPILYNKVKSAKLIGRGKRAEEEVYLYQCPNQQITDSLSRVAMHAMKLERSERYQKVQELQKDIESWQLGYATTAEEADFWRQIVLFISRNKAATIVGGLVALIGTTMVGWSIFADQKAKAAMKEMKTAVPLIEGELQNTIDAGDFDRALARLDSLVILLPDKSEYRLQRARILQSKLQFTEAAEEFELAGELEGEAEKYADDITFSQDLATKSGTNGLDDLSFEQFVNRLDREERFAEARLHRSQRIKKGREQMASIRPKVLKLVDEKAGLLISSTFTLAAADPASGKVSIPPVPDAHWVFQIRCPGSGRRSASGGPAGCEGGGRISSFAGGERTRAERVAAGRTPRIQHRGVGRYGVGTGAAGIEPRPRARRPPLRRFEIQSARRGQVGIPAPARRLSVRGLQGGRGPRHDPVCDDGREGCGSSLLRRNQHRPTNRIRR
ncbi:MAG: protein kinase domain-containing protein [Limisphaerales bacterium]